MPKSIELSSQTPAEAKSILSENGKPVLILYHMTMCPHCVALAPAWKEAEKKLGRTGITLVKIEYSYMGLLPASLRNIRGFPTIQVLENGKVKDEYVGDRSAESIVQFAKSHAATSVAVPKKSTTTVKKPAAKRAAKTT